MSQKIKKETSSVNLNKREWIYLSVYEGFDGTFVNLYILVLGSV